MPTRILKESICTSQTIDGLSPEEEVLFYRLIVNCDDYGRMEATPTILRSKCFPLRVDNIRNQMISKWMQGLVTAGLIVVYLINEKFYLSLCTWNKHQQIRAKRSKFPGQEDEGAQIIASENICNQLISSANKCPRNPIQSNPIQSLPSSDIKCNQKQKYADNVLLTLDEYKKLIEKFGELGARDRIEKLSLGKAAKGYKYKSDYAAILTWERRDAKPVSDKIPVWDVRKSR